MVRPNQTLQQTAAAILILMTSRLIALLSYAVRRRAGVTMANADIQNITCAAFIAMSEDEQRHSSSASQTVEE